MNSLRNNEKGFTIIEVVLVLAIAGLIFLMIFIAWPALQKNQRDTAKKNDVAVVATALGTWKSNKRGALPDNQTEFTTFINDYVPTLSQYKPSTDVQYDPITATSTPTKINIGSASGQLDIDKMWVVSAAKCAVDAQSYTAVQRASTRQVAIFVVIESGPAEGTVYCQEG